MEWPGGLKCKGTAAVALAWSGLFFACMSVYKTFAECAFSFTTEYIVFTPFTFNQKC